MTLPDYFSELKPFQRHFTEGHPILCYHKISLPPSKARIKGLYLSPQLFSQQMQEISQAGFSAMPPAASHSNQSAPITITFDDGFLSNLTAAVPCLKNAGVRAINYLVADRIGQTSDWEAQEGGEADPLMNESQIREWLAAGHWIGAHTCTHPRLSQLSRAQAKEEIHASKKKLEDQFGLRIDHFAYPFGDYDEEVVEMVREAGFRTACTMDRGVNDRGMDPFRLKRWTARYPTRTIGALFRKLFS